MKWVKIYTTTLHSRYHNQNLDQKITQMSRLTRQEVNTQYAFIVEQLKLLVHVAFWINQNESPSPHHCSPKMYLILFKLVDCWARQSNMNSTIAYNPERKHQTNCTKFYWNLSLQTALLVGWVCIVKVGIK